MSDAETISRLADVYEIRHAKAVESLKEELHDAVEIMAELILANFGAGDHTQNGQILANVIRQFAAGMRSARIRRELQATADEMGTNVWEQMMQNVTGKPAHEPL